MFKNTWIVVANSSKARFLEAVSNQELCEHTMLIHPESRMKGEDLASDKPGRSFDRVGVGRHHMGERDMARENEFIEFARHVSDYLVGMHKEGEIKKLFIIANPSFLGHLSETLAASIAELVEGKVNKDLTHLSKEKIREYLPEVF